MSWGTQVVDIGTIRYVYIYIYICVCYTYMYIYIYIYICVCYIHIYIYMYMCVRVYTYIYIWSRLPTARSPPNGMGPQVAPPFPSICKLLAAFLRSSLVFARFLQRFWLPASHLLGTCYLLDDLRSTHIPSKYLRATYSHIYIYNTCAMYLLPIYIYTL